MDVTIGSAVAMELGLSIGDKFQSTHGLSVGGHTHDEESFIVVGILKKSGTVHDNLILTNVESIWLIHDMPENDQHEDTRELQTDSITYSSLLPTHIEGDSTKEITSILIQYRSPMAAIQFPRIVNSQSKLQAASPAFETARLYTILGIGVEVLSVFAYVLIIVSALSIFIALYNSLKERRYDLAIMRSMGASRRKLVTTILLEGAALTGIGSISGFVAGHAIIIFMSEFLEGSRKAGITGIVFYSQEWIILGGSLVLGILCALLPAVQAYRTDISHVLAGN
jgi:putative ABC transport system permease protein